MIYRFYLTSHGSCLSWGATSLVVALVFGGPRVPSTLGAKVQGVTPRDAGTGPKSSASTPRPDPYGVKGYGPPTLSVLRRTKELSTCTPLSAHGSAAKTPPKERRDTRRLAANNPEVVSPAPVRSAVSGPRRGAQDDSGRGAWFPGSMPAGYPVSSPLLWLPRRF